MKRFPSTVIRLLLSSFVFVMGRAVALPFMALYLSDSLGLDQQAVGWIMGGSIFFSTLFGLYAGYLTDRLDKRRLMMFACIAVALCSLLVTVSAFALAALLALACIESALTLRSIALKAMLADLLPPDQRPRAFSMNYMLINMAFAIGPVWGAWLFAYQVAAPLMISAIFSLMASQIVGYQARDNITQPPATVPAVADTGLKPGFGSTLTSLKSDRRLIFFTLGSVLTSFVFGRFVSGYLSQYLILSRGTQATAKLIPYILITNAVTVVALQYPVGKLMQQKYLFRWVTLGVSLYALGLLGFMQADSVISWVMATLAFTLGEVIVIPCEYLFIDMIAPADKRGSYYGAQSLATFGAAFSPVVCGFLLAHFRSAVMFWTLIAAALMGVVLYYAGTRARASLPVVAAGPAQAAEKETRCVSCLKAASSMMASNRIRKLFPFS
ncbi:MFS transporter [Undibacterium sp. CY18W]|uniref:MFS transporter n=1 Tax=Undibacterium hunanense TaxID=2762292 RepID=A0ABR6ZRG3_9BURK|nr:MFS transporter [Undibacterium hunanense]MBC3918492.1 MFS transporter [Undibacterium hunanense]